MSSSTDPLSPIIIPGPKRRGSIAPNGRHLLLQSPTSPLFVLGSNDDNLERAQARAARAAAIRRKNNNIINNDDNPTEAASPFLDGDQIIELFRNCIKLASENKINQKNTWELKLIDHLSDIIKVEEEDDAETNFQKASCTLEAGVKIYALRVDSVHSEAYKVLGGISRAGHEGQQDVSAEGDNGSDEQDNQPKKETEKKLSPLSTLESSFEALNVKKFDVAFAVDPLYHQTTAQFDEGGAKGLLLNNLGVYGGCHVLFDSQEVPAKCMPPSNDNNSSSVVDISFAGECLDHLMMNMDMKKDICPTFRAIVEQLDDSSLQLRNNFQHSTCDDDAAEDSASEFNGGPEVMDMGDAADDQGVELDGGSFDNMGESPFDHADDVDDAGDSFDVSDQNHYEEQDPSVSSEHDMYDRFDNIASFLFGDTGITSSHNAWAGPDHWKYRKSKGSESAAAPASESASAAKKPKSKKASEADLEFTKSSDKDMPDFFAPPKNPKSLLLPSKRVPISNKLPEDCHYQPEDLVKLFLLPNVLCLGKRRRRTADNHPWQEDNGLDGSFTAWDNDSYSGPENDGCTHSDIEEQDTLVSQPRQVNKIEVQYDKTAKQVDVHLLKETLWEHLHVSTQEPEEEALEDALSFKHVLATFPDDCKAAAPSDISPHLCFICLLHLANEHGLTIQGSSNLDDLSIHFPASTLKTGSN